MTPAAQWLADHVVPEAINGATVSRDLLETCVDRLLRERDEAEARVTERLERRIGQYIERALRGAAMNNPLVRNVADDVLLGTWRYR